MQHLVFGAGLIGSFLALHLRAKLSNDLVNVVARASAHPNLQGELSITDVFGATLSTQASASWLAPPTQPVDVLWLTVKCTGLEQACRDLAPLITPDTLIMCCQNGIGSDSIVRQHFPKQRVLRVMVPFNVVKVGPRSWHRSSTGTVVFETSSEWNTDALAQQLNCATMPVTIATQMDALLWAKCQINLTNAVNALANLSLKETLMQREYRRLIAALMDEHLAVCQALGLDLPNITQVPAHWIPHIMRLPNWLFPIVAKKMVAIDPAAKLSMWWDLENGRLTEIDFINGATVAMGKRLAVAAPANEAVVTMIKQLERERQQGLPRRAVSASELMVF
jgi:2-dehydropantoate 2-reductase